MLNFALSGLIAIASPAAVQDQPFEAANGWRVFKEPQGCVAFFDTPGSSVSVFYPDSRDGLTFILHAGAVPAVSDTSEMVLIRVGKTQWGPIETKAYAPKEGLPGILFSARRPKALAEFAKAASITLTKRFQPPKTVPLAEAAKAADMLGRCVG